MCLCSRIARVRSAGSTWRCGCRRAPANAAHANSRQLRLPATNQSHRLASHLFTASNSIYCTTVHTKLTCRSWICHLLRVCLCICNAVIHPLIVSCTAYIYLPVSSNVSHGSLLYVSGMRHLRETGLSHSHSISSLISLHVLYTLSLYSWKIFESPQFHSSNYY